ncbi:MAG: YibE/F family protein [Leucobacter sp.]
MRIIRALGQRFDRFFGEPHSHAHVHGDGGRGASSTVTTSRTVRIVALALLAATAIATIWGLIALWPDGSKTGSATDTTSQSVADTRYERAEVLDIVPECEGDVPGPCLLVTVGLETGPDSGQVVELPVRGPLAESGLRVGDQLELAARAGQGGGEEGASSGGEGTGTGQTDTDQANSAADEPAYELKQEYGASGVFRGLPLALLTLVFAAVVIAVGRLRGLLALIALGISAYVLLAFVIPALISGSPGLAVALVGSSTIMFVILYLVHGPNMRTTAALIGTLCGILIMAGVSLIAVQTTRLSGIGDEASSALSTTMSQIDFRGLLSASIIIAGLGILNDVTITQSSSVWELRAAAPEMSRREIYASAMRIGRDHIASTVYTVFFAYVGAAVSVLILLYLFDRPLLSLLTHEDIAIEIVRTLCGSIGLVLAVPITTWVATLFVPAADERGAAGA